MATPASPTPSIPTIRTAHGYLGQMVAAYGEQRAHEILGEVRHNTVYFPNIMVKGAVQILRNFIPIAVDKTLVESWVYRLVGAPDKLYERALMYNRFINAPTSIVGHDDLEMYERAQEGLKSTAINGSICGASTKP